MDLINFLKIQHFSFQWLKLNIDYRQNVSLLPSFVLLYKAM